MGCDMFSLHVLSEVIVGAIPPLIVDVDVTIFFNQVDVHTTKPPIRLAASVWNPRSAKTCICCSDRG